MDFVIVALIAAGGSFLQSTAGFGYALITMALWPMLLPFRAAAAMEIATATTMVFYIVIKYRKYINWKTLVWPLITALLFNLLGYRLMVVSGESLLRRLMGALLIVLFVYYLCYADKLSLRPTPMTGLIAGVIGGFCGGLLGIGGPPMVAYFISSTDSKQEYAGTMQCYFLFSGVQMLIVHTVTGSFTPDVLRLGVGALAGVAIGTAAGLALFKRLKMEYLKKLVYPLLGCVGLYLLITG